jgi:hypothetical protein
MRHEISRRLFFVLAGGALAAPRFSWSGEQVPSLLDHILLGCNDLDRGISLVEERTGVRAAFGGIHPGQGTQNALLSRPTLRPSANKRLSLALTSPSSKPTSLSSAPRSPVRKAVPSILLPDHKLRITWGKKREKENAV